MFTKKDLEEIKNKGMCVETVEQQIKNFENGFPFMDIIKPATQGDGIIRLDRKSVKNYIEEYENSLQEKTVLKFVPASGAASRMFKDLFEFSNQFGGKLEDISKDFFVEKGFAKVFDFFENLEKFAFYNELCQAMEKKGENLLKAKEDKEYGKIIRFLLTEEGLNYGKLPKGLLKFHSYETEARTPVEEHLVEAANYCKSGNKAKIHLTVSPEHREIFLQKIEDTKAKYEKEYKVKYEIDFSKQKPSTDTIAVDLENEPFRNLDDTMLFRPGGHGALIYNLNEINQDYIFIKNIDNVVPDHLKQTTFEYKKALAGILIKYQKQIFNYLQKTEISHQVEEDLIFEIIQFIEKDLCVVFPEDFYNLGKVTKIDYLRKKLNRPIRVCGMVKNEGEPGGGPFWAMNNDGTISLQIVEGSQIDNSDSEKQEIVKKATHFNPVDLFCSVKNYRGKKFDLLNFIDTRTGFISQKSKDGKDLKAQELPGLWNGAMSDWNTIFLEIPIITFNPVKTINDLLRKEHQKQF